LVFIKTHMYQDARSTKHLKKKLVTCNTCYTLPFITKTFI